MTVEFELDGRRLVAINGGPQFTFDEAISLMIECDDQADIDRYWDALTAGGGEEGPCGWCKDRFGLSWQVVPKGMDELFASGDRDRVARATRAMLAMKRIDIAALERAVAFGRWRAGDVRSILEAGTGVARPTAPGDALIVELPTVPTRALADYAPSELS